MTLRFAMTGVKLNRPTLGQHGYSMSQYSNGIGRFLLLHQEKMMTFLQCYRCYRRYVALYTGNPEADIL